MIDQLFDQLFRGEHGRFILGMLLSIAAGFLIGAERELRGKDAGVRTQSLVISGAMLFTFISSIVDPDDKVRIAANIVTGIGFLGAGIILKAQTGHVHNLTTAASIWASSAIGMAFGFGYYFIGIAGTLFLIFIPWLPNIKRKGPKLKKYYNEADAARFVDI